MKNLEVQSFGPIESVKVDFGDLTILIGPQASGKSIFLQLLKLIVDKGYILKSLQQYNYILNRNPQNILDIFFGEGMNNVWRSDSKILFDNSNYTQNYLIGNKNDTSEELFYIPAQRILSISDGRPKNFMEFDISIPYVLRQFSEILRLYLQNGMGREASLFPNQSQLTDIIGESVKENIFYGGTVVMDERTGQKKMRLEVEDISVPFMTWSAGQKEFMPLLLAFYCLAGSPSKVIKREKFKYVVIEEPEMGLHPQAIKTILLQVVHLLSKNYKVIISTHSPIFLEFTWAINLLKSQKCDVDPIFELFDLKKSEDAEMLFKELYNKTINTFYFFRDNNKVISKDISSLDAGSEDLDIAEWGGISSFAGKVCDIVSKYFSNEN